MFNLTIVLRRTKEYFTCMTAASIIAGEKRALEITTNHTFWESVFALALSGNSFLFF